MRKIVFALALTFTVAAFSNCGTAPPKKELTISEQIEVDTKNAQELSEQFKQHVSFTSRPSAERFLKSMVERILAKREGFQKEKIVVKVHEDSDPKLKYLFSFPAMTISIPSSFVKKVQFENELAAGLAYEVATIMNRDLAKKVEKDVTSGLKPVLLGSPSVFDQSQDERLAAIRLAITLLLESGYDIRGVASIFTRFPQYYVRESTSDLFQKAVAFNLREARRADSEYLPQIDPVVRSGEFIQFKKELLHAQP